MKKIVLIMLVALPMVACVGKKSADKIKSERDSLAIAVAEKDSIINDVFASIDGIAENLGAIKSRENIITSNIESGEIKKQTATQISEDIEAINQLLLKNKEELARLEANAAKLRKSNAGLNSMIAKLKKQVEDKDSEITSLKKQLSDLNVKNTALTKEVAGLSTKVDGLSKQNTALEGEVKATADIMNTGYYIIGPEKELLKNEIIYKSGFIGRTLKINENRSLDSFTKIDLRTFGELLIGHKKVTLVSYHAKGSYEFVMDDKDMFISLVITDKAKFWEYSKVLVISYK